MTRKAAASGKGYRKKTQPTQWGRQVRNTRPEFEQTKELGAREKNTQT